MRYGTSSSAIARVSDRTPPGRHVMLTEREPLYAAPEGMLMIASEPDDLRYGSGQLMIGTELMLFLGLPSMTRSL